MFLAKPLVIAVVSGLVWGTVAYGLLCNESTWGRISDFSWLCFILSPVIGILVYYLSYWIFSKSIWVRILWSILMLYFSSGLLGLFLVMADFFHPLRSGSEVWYSFTEMPLSFWWGITFSPLLWTLFLFAFGNQELIKYLVKKSTV
jgi:hypothetical protein